MVPDSSAAGTNSAGVTQIIQRAASDWLSLRRPADELARASTLTAVARLNAHASNGGLSDPDPLLVYDLGAGTGANLSWLAPHLSVAQQWTLVDRDAELLDMVPRAWPTDRVVDVRRVVAELDDLPRLHPIGGVPALITCSALLDVLTVNQVEALCGFVAATQSAALFSLSVSGDFGFAPALALDRRILTTFNEHQNRKGLAGPSATAIAAEALQRRGLDVEVIATPWELSHTDGLWSRPISPAWWKPCANRTNPSPPLPASGWISDSHNCTTVPSPSGSAMRTCWQFRSPGNRS